jgi:hypothetical protein
MGFHLDEGQIGVIALVQGRQDTVGDLLQAQA